ncbi:Hypothetical predicted protein [Octopus vulgaris]|uniref:Uncharacterized protein n=1 Tax=Octopus vulgaris TaxID=6645 RepID=A0AA36BK27_OCTVU|nr:Hypothetical predicted protein [Octopus vulgaris]
MVIKEKAHMHGTMKCKLGKINVNAISSMLRDLVTKLPHRDRVFMQNRNKQTYKAKNDSPYLQKMIEKGVGSSSVSDDYKICVPSNDSACESAVQSREHTGIHRYHSDSLLTGMRWML